MESKGEQLGEVTVPSGILVVIDCGLLGMWSHDRPPAMPEGVIDPQMTESANAGTDFEVVGPDAEQAGRRFDRQWHPRFVYDIPRHGVREMVECFEQAMAGSGFAAELRPLPRRVPHRSRIDQALKYGRGAGEVLFHGLTGGLVSGLPTDRPLPVHGVRFVDDEFSGYWEHVEVRFRSTGDFRPHSHHHALMAQIRATATDSGTLEVGGAQLCAFHTTWGDGYFPVLRVLEDDELVAVRVHLAIEDIRAALRESTQ